MEDGRRCANLILLILLLTLLINVVSVVAAAVSVVMMMMIGVHGGSDRVVVVIVACGGRNCALSVSAVCVVSRCCLGSRFETTHSGSGGCVWFLACWGLFFL